MEKHFNIERFLKVPYFPININCFTCLIMDRDLSKCSKKVLYSCQGLG